jgi:hypothetical protein
MFRRTFLAALTLGLFLSQSTPAANLTEFCFQDPSTGEESCALYFDGMVLPGDAERLEKTVLDSGAVLVLINSPGGSALEGVLLNEVAIRHSLRTVAGKDFGAWSAAAVFWMGGTREYESQNDSLVGIHWAYMPGMPEYNTDLINSIITLAIYDAEGHSRVDTQILLFKMEIARSRYGTQGFVIRSQDRNWEIKDMNSSQTLRERLESISSAQGKSL